MQKTKTKAKPNTLKGIPQFVTVGEICEALRVTRWTVKRMIERGDLEQKKFGRNVRVTLDSFRRYVENA
jgi:excisionase family DNA binding protein